MNRRLYVPLHASASASIAGPIAAPSARAGGSREYGKGAAARSGAQARGGRGRLRRALRGGAGHGRARVGACGADPHRPRGRLRGADRAAAGGAHLLRGCAAVRRLAAGTGPGRDERGHGCARSRRGQGLRVHRDGRAAHRARQRHVHRRLEVRLPGQPSGGGRLHLLGGCTLQDHRRPVRPGRARRRRRGHPVRRRPLLRLRRFRAARRRLRLPISVLAARRPATAAAAARHAAAGPPWSRPPSR